MTVRFRGFISDSVSQAFKILVDEKEKNPRLREEISASTFVSITMLQSFARKAISSSLAIPECIIPSRSVFSNLVYG